MRYLGPVMQQMSLGRSFGALNAADLLARHAVQTPLPNLMRAFYSEVWQFAARFRGHLSGVIPCTCMHEPDENYWLSCVLRCWQVPKKGYPECAPKCNNPLHLKLAFLLWETPQMGFE